MPSGFYKRKDTHLLFLEKIVKRENGCWEWTASIKPQGYGEFRVKGKKSSYAHRYSFEHYHKETIPKEKCVDHICENKICVNPEHLRLLSYSENVKRGPLGRINKTTGKLRKFRNEAKRICGLK